jgi:hypothetical protein
VASTILNSNSANNYGTVTISSTSSYFSTGSVTIPSSYHITNGNITTSNPWTTGQGSLNVTGDAEIEGDLKVGGVSIVKTLAEINKRLAILVPDPAKLEHFEALKKAYEHYKTLEALCQLPKKESD